MVKIEQERFEVVVLLDIYVVMRHVKRMEFFNKSKKFGREYDMRGLGSKKRCEETKATITKLEEELRTLKQGNDCLYHIAKGSTDGYILKTFTEKTLKEKLIECYLSCTTLKHQAMNAYGCHDYRNFRMSKREG